MLIVLIEMEKRTVGAILFSRQTLSSPSNNPSLVIKASAVINTPNL